MVTSGSSSERSNHPGSPRPTKKPAAVVARVTTKRTPSMIIEGVSGLLWLLDLGQGAV